MALTGNTLTYLMPSLYENLDVISREMVGYVPAVTLDSNANRMAYGQTVYSQVAPAVTAADIAAAMTIPAAAVQTIGSKTLSISKVRAGYFSWTGEDQKMVADGPGLNPIKSNQIQQCIRTLVNEIEVDLGALSIYASRAGLIDSTTLLSTDLQDVGNLMLILDQNGAPQGDRQFVMDNYAASRLFGLGNMTKVNEAGDTTFMRQGILGEVGGFILRKSGGVSRNAIGTMTASPTVGTAAYAVGDTTLVLASAGSGTIVAGDVITLAGDTNQYVVATGDTQTSDGGSIVLAAPGLRQAIAGAASPVISIVAKGYRPMAFSRSAIVLATRLPVVPMEGDLAIDSTTLTDPRSGISFDVRVYPGHHMVTVEVGCAWGVAAVKTEHIAVGLGS